MRARVDPVDYKHTNDKGRVTTSRAYALVDPRGKPLFVGLFISPEKAQEYCKAHGWTLVAPPT